MFKKIILSLCLLGMLFAYTPVQAEMTTDDLAAQITKQIEDLQVQLQIQMLLEQIASLQAQIAIMLEAQTAQGAVLNQVVVNTTPAIGGAVVEPLVAPVCTPNWQCSEWNTCSDYSQSRTCENSCDLTKKAEKQDCVSVGAIEATLIGNDVKVSATGNSYTVTGIEFETDATNDVNLSGLRTTPINGKVGFYGIQTKVQANSYGIFSSSANILKLLSVKAQNAFVGIVSVPVK